MEFITEFSAGGGSGGPSTSGQPGGWPGAPGAGRCAGRAKRSAAAAWPSPTNRPQPCLHWKCSPLYCHLLLRISASLMPGPAPSHAASRDAGGVREALPGAADPSIEGPAQLPQQALRVQGVKPEDYRRDRGGRVGTGTDGPSEHCSMWRREWPAGLLGCTVR